MGDRDRWVAGRGINTRMIVDTHHQLKVGVRDLSGRGVRAGERCLQLTVGVRDRALAGRGKQHETKPYLFKIITINIPPFSFVPPFLCLRLLGLIKPQVSSKECNPQQKTVLYSSRERRAESR